MKSILLKLAGVAVILGILYPAIIHMGFAPNHPNRIFEENTGLSLNIAWSRLIYAVTGSPSGEAIALLDQGLNAGENDDWAQATSLFREALMHAPNATGFHYALAKGHQYAGNPAGAALHMTVYSHEDDEFGRTAETYTEISASMIALQEAFKELFNAAWAIAEMLPSETGARDQVLRAAIRAKAWEVRDKILYADYSAAAPLFASVGVELAREGRLDESEYVFRDALVVAEWSATASIPALCGPKRLPPRCEQRVVHQGIMGLPAITEEVCNQPQRVAFGRDEELLQVHGFTLMAIAVEEASVGKHEDALSHWADGSSKVEQSRLDYLCDTPAQLSGLTPTPPDQSMSGGWSFAEPDVLTNPAERPFAFYLPKIEWPPDALKETVAISNTRQLDLSQFEYPLPQIVETLRQNYLIEEMPRELAKLGEDYAALYDILLPYAMELQESLRQGAAQ